MLSIRGRQREREREREREERERREKILDTHTRLYTMLVIIIKGL